MKKNLLFALGVFLITIAGLFIFSQTSQKKVEDSTKLESLEKVKDDKAITLVD